jgi:hypothetical protein
MKIIKLIASVTLILIDISFGNTVIAGEKQKLPFTGTKWFNLYGGTGTGQSITIEKNGRTVIKVHGTVSTGVIYKGRFSNPITINDEGTIYKYLFKNKKIYELDQNGQIKKGCRREGEVCEAELSKS